MDRLKSDIFPLPQAHPRNRSNAYKCPHSLNVETAEVYGGTGKPVRARIAEAALERLVKFNRDHYILAHHIGEEQFEEIAHIDAQSEADLVDQSSQVLVRAITPALEDPNLPGKNKADLAHATLAGCGVTVAFLDVIARMQAQVGDEPFDGDAFRDVATKSFSSVPRFVAATSEDADAALTASMMNWSRSQAAQLKNEGDKEYFGLLFDRTFFRINEGTVALKGDKETRKRVRRDGGSQYDFSPNKDTVIIGCPFTPYLRDLWKAMIEPMVENGFAEEAYQRSLETRLNGSVNDDWRWTA